MFQESNCTTCVFRQIVLESGADFDSLNSFQIKSMIVRPGCSVLKRTNGALYYDSPYTQNLTGTNPKLDVRVNCITKQKINVQVIRLLIFP